MLNQGVWAIAGFDPLGLAGILVDVVTIKNFSVPAGAIITALTAQSTHSLSAIQATPLSMVQAQCHALQQSLIPKAIKLGMLGSLEIIEFLQQYLVNYSGWVVLDPVLATSFEDKLYFGGKDQYLQSMQTLFPYVDLITPNILEAEAIAKTTIISEADLHFAAEKILALGAKSVLIKGGHSNDPTTSKDFYTDGENNFYLVNQRVGNKIYRGTGCTLSSAIAACLALDYAMADALTNASAYVHRGIRQATDFGLNTAQLFHGLFNV